MSVPLKTISLVATTVNVRLLLDVGWVKLLCDPTFTTRQAAWLAPPVTVGSRDVLDPIYVQKGPRVLSLGYTEGGLL
jgi:hypothetical protein